MSQILFVLLVFFGKASGDCVLERVKERAQTLTSFVHAMSSTDIFAGGTSSVLTSNHLEIVVCRPIGVAFVHVFKAAGTTGMYLLEKNCPAPLEQYIHWPCENEVNKHASWRCHELPHDAGEVFANVSQTFTFVRDPVDRFQSAVFEFALRDMTYNRSWLQRTRAKAEASGTTVADVAIAEIGKAFQRHIHVDQHMIPQTFSLIHDGSVVPFLSHIALVGPGFEEELEAISMDLFNTDLPEDVGHERDSQNTEYSGSLTSLRSELLMPQTLLKIYRVYSVDYAWIGNFHYEKYSR